MAKSPLIAIGSPPLTGASRKSTPFAKHSLYIFCDTNGEIELISITADPFFNPCNTPFSEIIAASEFAESCTITITTSTLLPNSFASEHPLAPDYSNLDNWAAYPEKDGQQFYLPDSSLPLNKNNNDVDVFYIHPTGFFEKTWNSFMEKDRAAYERTEMMLGNQISAFNDSCNIYAPEYRQATYYSYFAKNSDGMLAHDLAFEDILNSYK